LVDRPEDNTPAGLAVHPGPSFAGARNVTV